MTMFQFMVFASTGVAVGKKQKTKKGTRKIRAMILIAMPARPKDQRAGGSGSRRRRLERMQPMERI